jgi:hypothetical protein
MIVRCQMFAVLVSATLGLSISARAQQQHEHPPAPPDKSAEEESHEQPHGEHAMMSMRGLYGPYPMTREASGTSWQPESTPMLMKHAQYGSWNLMTMGFANGVYPDSQARGRGDEDLFAESMGMLMTHRNMGGGTLGLRAMLSLDPWLVGKDGYPLLFQTGETANGRTPLIDRQHPHDLFMELSASYSVDLGSNRSVFLYAALPGEPAIGPVTYMHRASGMDNPEAPLGHHWLDSTHITFGVVTAGVVVRDVKFEASAFNGREPDEDRYNIETRSFDSWSLRASWNPTADWATQLSFARLDSPEQLEPDVDIDRTTASVTYNKSIGSGYWQSTLAVARNSKRARADTDAYLLESALRLPSNTTAFARAERVEKDELFAEGDPLHDRVFTVNTLSVGAVHHFVRTRVGSVGVGAVYSLHFVPDAVESVYGGDPDSWLVFARWRVE